LKAITNDQVGDIRTVVTGANSFIGRHVVEHLTYSGLKVTAICRSYSPFLENLSLINKNIEIKYVNLVHLQDYDQLPKKADVLVHIAGISLGMEIPFNDMVNVNVVGTEYIHQYAQQSGISKIIYTSSMSVYGEIGGQVVNENTPIVNPESYGLTKLLGEKIFQTTEKFLPAISIRLPGVLGIGASRSWLPSTVKKLRNSEIVAIHSPQALFNNAIHVSELSQFIEKLVISCKWSGFRAFPIGASSSMQIIELVNIFKKITNSKSPIKVLENISSPFLISSDHAVKNFGFKAASIEETINKYIMDLSQ
jgi:nucleoside-diphosphate-sugar epimerase